MHLLVTGGAGYVGSHVARVLLDHGHSLVIVDDLSSGHREALPDRVLLHEGRCGNHRILDRAAGDRLPDAVVHLAAKCSVDESVVDPAGYYRCNLADGMQLLDWMVERGVRWIVHSSTCAVYGHPEKLPIDEKTCARPINPYGATKLALDLAIECYEAAYDFAGICLRYFNAGGAHPAGDLGEDKTPRTNLIPRVFDVALGHEPFLSVCGDDYPTDDGTGVRDYVHVLDLAEAHATALERLASGAGGGVFNLGTGSGHSVLEVVRAAREVTEHEIPIRIGARRPGDPAALVADPTKARRDLGWAPQRSDLRTLIADAWGWRASHPNGYRLLEASR